MASAVYVSPFIDRSNSCHDHAPYSSEQRRNGQNLRRDHDVTLRAFQESQKQLAERERAILEQAMKIKNYERLLRTRKVNQDTAYKR